MKLRTESPADPLLVSPAQAARLLNVGRTTLYGMLATGRIASFRRRLLDLIP